MGGASVHQETTEGGGVPIRANKGVNLYHAKQGHRVIYGGLMLYS